MNFWHSILFMIYMEHLQFYNIVSTFFQAQWKLTSILLLFDAYTKLVHQRQNGDQINRPMPDSVLYSAFEWDLYFNYFLALLGKTYLILFSINIVASLCLYNCYGASKDKNLMLMIWNIAINSEIQNWRIKIKWEKTNSLLSNIILCL